MKKLIGQSGLASALAALVATEKVHSVPVIVRKYSSIINDSLAEKIREYKLIQAKKSKLSASQRAYIVSRIQQALIEGYITKDDLN